MYPVERPKDEKHLSTDNCQGIASNFDELKTTQLLKDEDANQPHSSKMNETKTFPLQVPPNFTFTSSDKAEIFPSPYELHSIEKFEKNVTEIACFSNQIHLSSEIKREEINAGELYSSTIEEMKTSPLQIFPNSFFTTSDKDEIFSSYYELDSIEKTEKDATETAGSLIQMHLSLETKREKTNTDEQHSSTIEEMKTSPQQISINSSFTASDKDEIFSSDCELDSILKSEKDARETNAGDLQSSSLKISPISTFTTSDKNKIFSSHYELDSIEKSGKDTTEAADSSIQIQVSSETKREEINAGELRSSPLQMSPNFSFTTSDRDKIFSFHCDLDFIEKSEEDASEIVCSSIQILSSEAKREEINAGELHSSTIKETKTSPLQIFINSTFTTSDNDKMFSSDCELDSIVKSEKDATESASSSIQILLSSETKSEQTNADELNSIPAQISQNSIFMMSDKDKIFSTHCELDSIEKSEKYATETACSSIEIHLSSETKREKTNESELHSSTVKETKTPVLQMSPNSTFTTSDKNKIFSSDCELDSIVKSEKDATETASSLIQMHVSSEIKREEANIDEVHECLNDDENQLTFGIFPTSETSATQEPPCPPVTSLSLVQMHPSATIKEEETSVSPSNDYKIFSPHHEIYLIEMEEEIGMETTDSSVRKLLSSIIKIVETSVDESSTNLNYVGNQLHYLEFQISKTSPTTSNSILTPFNEEKLLSPRLVIDFIENSEKNHSENVVSSAQKRLNSTVKKKKKKVCKSHRNFNNVENQPPSTIFQLSKSCPMQTTSNSIVTTTNEEQKISFRRKTSLNHQQDRSTENLEKKIMETVSSSVQIPMCSRIKCVKDTVGGLRKSLRLLELKNNSSSSQAVRTDQNAKKRARKRKSSVNSASPSYPEARRKKTASSINQNPNALHPSRMKLKSIVLIPAPRKSDAPSMFMVDNGIYPRFANVDPSKVLSSLNRQTNITKSLACGKAISLFLPGRLASQEKTSGQSKLSSNQKLMPIYKFKKVKFRPLHLSKKRPAIDSFTMDKCYSKLFSFPKLLK